VPPRVPTIPRTFRWVIFGYDKALLLPLAWICAGVLACLLIAASGLSWPPALGISTVLMVLVVRHAPPSPSATLFTGQYHLKKQDQNG